MSEQLLLDIQLRADQSFENFIYGENQILIDHLQHTSQNILIWGEKGVGKSHLLNSCCIAYQQHLVGSQITLIPFEVGTEQTFPVEILIGLERCSLICLDNIDAVFGNFEWEKALFHLLNRAKDTETRIVASMTGAPKTQNTNLADLASRLSNFLIFEIKPLNDSALLDVLKMKASERGIKLEEEVLNYIASRGPRSSMGLNSLLDILDRESLKAKRPITIPFLKQFVEW